MDLKKIAEEIREVIEKRKNELELGFIEDDHVYFMKDTDGVIKNTFPSVSKIVKRFHIEFDSETKALEMSNGDKNKAKKLLMEWAESGNRATSMGSRVHYFLESELVSQYNNYKNVREPIFDCDDELIDRSNSMIVGGKEYIDLMHERGAVLLDTEMVLGDPELGYVGQPDKVWLILNKNKTGYGFVITDWKGLPLDTPILTNNGWKTMGTLTFDDMVFDKDGELVKIKNISKVKNVKCIKIKFNNGEEIVSDFEHRWLVYTSRNGIKKHKVLTTLEIKEYYDTNKDLKSYDILKIENAKPLKTEKVNLQIDPYVFGVWLGDGHSADGKITQMNENVWSEIKKRGYDIGQDVSKSGAGRATTRTIFGLRHELAKLNLLKNKHIPDVFILSSYEQRVDLLRGLMDSDGYYNKKRKRFIISTTRTYQVNFCVELISSLGLKSKILKYYKKINDKKIQCYNVEFSTNDFNPFLCRNQDINIEYKKDKRTYRNIVSVEEVESVPTKCIEVDSQTSTFLFGKSLIVTHNTNQERKFQVQHYTKKMLSPFELYHDTALTHYFVQLPLYGKLLLKMLESSKFKDIKLLGCVITHLKDNKTFTEYKVPQDMTETILKLNVKNYLK